MELLREIFLRVDMLTRIGILPSPNEAVVMGKKIVLSGATRGLGRALVAPLTQVKHVVAGCGRTASLIDELAKKYPAPNHFTAVDVRDAAAVNRWADAVLAAVGVPDLLICNAALMNDPAPLWRIHATDFDAVIDVNVKGVVNVIRAFAPAMVARKHGVIVTLSSGWGRSTSPEVAPYCASKYAIEGLTLALAQELPAGMAAVPLNPGVIDTDMLRQCWKDKAASFPKADAWAKRAVPFLLNLSAKENGRSLNVPS
jgi:NAD(P)-dependent dehydrogenase (short-subunit alcohol dehydrogenase family)